MKIVISVFISFLLSCGCFSQTPDYAEIFGDDWIKAENYEKENRVWLEPLLTRNHISYPVAISVIFPELVRYSALRDKMEVALLKTLYVNLGEDYANFSIGEFQMKPSFAEEIRSESSRYPGLKNGFKKNNDYENIKTFRKEIVKDLESREIQVKYLVIFIKICERKFNVNRMEDDAKIRFLATAYNYGFERSRPAIEAGINKKFFSTKLVKGENYCYSDVSLFWYKKFLEGK